MLKLRPPAAGRPLIIGHRGASGDAPENTMSAFQLALEQGADLIESDVQLSADGVPVVIHDPTVDRTTNGRGLVSAMTIEEIRSLIAKPPPGASHDSDHVPTLEELLGWAAGRVAVAIEIKRDGPIRHPEAEAKVVELLRRHGMVDQAIIISFDHTIVRRTRDICPEVATGVLFACAPVSPATLALDAQSQALLPHWSSLSAEMIQAARESGLAVAPWVVDGVQEMEWVLSLGVDALATNHPARLAALLGQTSRGADPPD